MAKFCGKCGSKIDDITGICPECSNISKAENTYKTKTAEITVFADDTEEMDITADNDAETAEKSYSPKFCGKCGCKMDSQTGKCPVCDSPVFARNTDSNNNTNDKFESDYQKEDYEEKSSKGKLAAVIVSSVLVVVMVAFLALDLFEVIDTGIFRNLGITPFSSESSADEADKSQEDKENPEQSAQDETTIAELTENSSESTNESSQQSSEDAELWKNALIECVNESENDDAVFSLVYINDDDIPEVYAVKKSQTSGSDMVYYTDTDGNTNGTSIGNKSLRYMERGNLCCSHESDGDTVYTIDNGWKILHNGYSYTESNKTYYTWQNAEVTEKEYNSQLKAVFDISKAKNASDKTYSRKEIIEKINKL